MANERWTKTKSSQIKTMLSGQLKQFKCLHDNSLSIFGIKKPHKMTSNEGIALSNGKKQWNESSKIHLIYSFRRKRLSPPLLARSYYAVTLFYFDVIDERCLAVLDGIAGKRE